MVLIISQADEKQRSETKPDILRGAPTMYMTSRLSMWSYQYNNALVISRADAIIERNFLGQNGLYVQKRPSV
jgi:hypothetical protein